MSHHTTIIATTNGNNSDITNFHSVLKMIANYKELMLKLLFVHKRRFAFGSLQETFKFRFGYDLGFKNNWV
jgi:hypothetical protein